MNFDDADTAVCPECGERDVIEALVPVYVATGDWHRCERLLHPECKELFVSANLGAILESLRLGVVS